MIWEVFTRSEIVEKAGSEGPLVGPKVGSLVGSVARLKDVGVHPTVGAKLGSLDGIMGVIVVGTSDRVVS
jgi:hypothetical protein